MQKKVNLKSKSIDELKEIFKGLKEPAYRAQQLFVWMWRKGVEDISLYSNFSKKLRSRLENDFYVGKVERENFYISSDGAVKYVFRKEDGKRIESVYIPSDDRTTVCVSTQVGCPLGCFFCATGKRGFEGNLEGWEIADQVLQISKHQQVRISNVVFMGMGEPLLNLHRVKEALYILNSSFGMGIGARRMTVSTAGIVEGILDLANFSMQIRLALSLNSAIQEKREEIMPVTRKYPLYVLKDALKIYYQKTHRMVTLEYVLIGKFNTGWEDFLALKEFSKDLKVKINLIPFNPVEGVPFHTPTKKEVERFFNWCLSLPCSVNIRQSRGRDIKGACGQLAGIEGREKIGVVEQGVNH
ncbi:23S rRNA (adenine(2503)-C(2))-methyltransferase RlmN [Candidatus Aerophobetes bacterium]|nr:23S rRNA (adenine(2503)-C(2))-methyltransferase RlmN [Candidatus Aerophobetes bacterium]